MNPPSNGGTGPPVVSRITSRAWIACLLVAGAACVLYAGTLSHEFVWDDRYLVVEPGSPAHGPLGAIWKASFPLGGGVYYRPLILLTYWVEIALFGLEPFASHAFQILLYGLSVAAVFWLVRVLVGAGSDAGTSARLGAPVAAAALFAAHPVHVETVAFISARADLLAGTLSVMAVAASLKAVAGPVRSRAGWVVLSGLSCFAGLLCKEAALATPVLTWLALRTRSGGNVRSRFVAPLLAQAVAVAGYALVRTLSGSWVKVGDMPWGSPLRILAAFGLNTELLFAPVRQRVYHRLPTGEDGAVLAFWGVVALGALVVLAIRAWRRSPVLACSLIWIPVSLLPVSGVLVIQGAPVSERFLFLPSVGVCLLAAAGVERFRARITTKGRAARIATASLLVVLAALTALTIHRQPVYASDQALYQRMIEEYPTLALGHLGLGVLHQEAGRPDLAVEHLERAVEHSPEIAPVPHQQGEAHRWLGLAYLSLGRLAEAIAQLESATDQRPADSQLLVNLGSAYLQAERLDDAEQALRRALDLSPDLGEAEINLGMVLARRGEHEEALPHFRRGADLLPGLPDAHFNLGNAYARSGRNAKAVTAYRRALELAPKHEGARRNLQVVLGRLAEE